MEINVNKLRRSVQKLRELLPVSGSHLPVKEIEKIYKEEDVENLFKNLSNWLLDSNFTIPIAVAFEEYILLIITTALRCSQQVDASNYVAYQHEGIALAKLMEFSLDAKRYGISYFHNKPAIFKVKEYIQQTPNKKPKNAKNQKNSTVDHLELVQCCYRLLQIDPVYLRDLWDWSSFVTEFFKNPNNSEIMQLYCNNIVSILTNMTPIQSLELNAKISTQTLLDFEKLQSTCRFTMQQKLQKDPSPIDEQIITLNLSTDTIQNIEGVFLPIYNADNSKFYAQSDGSYDTIVKVDSTKVNLRSIALGIAAGKAICLSGSVGCGKTTLVEYLARKTGRICPKQKELDDYQSLLGKENQENEFFTKKVTAKDKISLGSKRKNDIDDIENTVNLNEFDAKASTNGFLRIQLGDQTDSKMLLGQYRCTDVPGEFIWLPGVLTQAVMNGYWLLLEDLDAATQDTYTILSSLLERNYLSVPGFRDCVKVEPGFQLFVTVRTNKSSANSAQKSLYTLIEKYLYTINILPLSRNELCKVVSTNYPKLATVANRIVDVFLTFSSGDHTSADNLRQQETGDKADTTEKFVALPFERVTLASMPNSGRLVSTRDLIKLCQRSNPMFSVTSTECAYFVFQNAVDVFCSYLPQGKEKTTLITSIGAKLGIIQSRCEHFANEYKPDVQIDSERIKVGRATLHSKSKIVIEDDADRLSPQTQKRQKLTETTERHAVVSTHTNTKHSTFSFTRLASCILERIAVCVSHAEPVLLVGETGVGKTSSVQYLAERTQHKLVVVNMNNQSDVSDLVGGFKPVELTYVIAPLRYEFELLFRKTFNQTKNEVFLNKFAICFNEGNHNVLLRLMLKVCSTVFEKSEQKVKDLLPSWQELHVKLVKLNSQLAKSINISFAFIPGSLVNCIKNGDWVLLDEINLASAETLECLSTILEPDGSVVLLEKGDFTPVKRHPDFRIFACMNPNTDIGKKDLSVGIRNRFTEFFVDELTTDADLSLLISDYLKNTGIQRKSVHSIVKLYKKLKILSQLELSDGLGNRPVYSLRTLCRSLRICAKNLCGSIERNLYESFCLSFLTQLDPASHNIVLLLIKDALLTNPKAILKQALPKLGENYLDFEGYWIQKGQKAVQECANYILTDSVKNNLKDLARIISIGKLPILLQGPTSAGKTSLIDYVAKRSGNHCLRINNHEHTDLQEYIGTYAADETGKLSFKEGVLVQAMRHGYWIILDELNLASTDILEALNRVLDDNRELFIPETQTVVKAHPNFMLFATQNPPGLYGGRKTLSRAFKNRFIELHFSDIPRPELETILEKRCLIPPSYAKKMVSCMSDLQKNRKTTTKNVFTLRDLFRWGNRYTFADKTLLNDPKYDWNQHLIEEGYLVLSAKVRTSTEINIIEEALYRNFKKRVNLELLFDVQTQEASSPVTSKIINAIRTFKARTDIVWTRNMTRMAVLTAKALQFDEPVLLVGPTGCGKTTVCQLLANISGVQLRILNCHMHTEGADFLGGLRPCRKQTGDSHKLFEWADGPLIHAMQEGSYFMADEISLAEDSVLERLNCILEPERTVLLAEKGGVGETEMSDLNKEFVVQAKSGFQFLATMNPGGDFGKKELSPALRNRFTEVWCQPSDNKADLVEIAYNCMLDKGYVVEDKQHTRKIAEYLVEIVLYIRSVNDKFKFSVRDILAWANYMVINARLSFAEQAIFGLETIFLDALEMLPHESPEQVELLKTRIAHYAVEQAGTILNNNFSVDEIKDKRGQEVELSEQKFGIKPFYIPTNHTQANATFYFDAPTTKQNLFRLLSALSLRKPVLLEGPPGVGKTSIVESIAHAIGYQIVRINLCEHTDLADLFGTDLPAADNLLEGTATAKQKVNQLGAFVWRDGPLLAALKSEHTWILLDEMNLAPQSVLEGLNAILDHRGEVYIPELNKSFQLSKHTRIFACQNPLKQGGGRKGLPQSFLNRFNKVYLRKLSTADLLHVVNVKYASYFEALQQHFVSLLHEECYAQRNLFDIYHSMQSSAINASRTHDDTRAVLAFDLAARLVKFSEILERGVACMEFGYKGGPYEFNLRDILRWCDMLHNKQTEYTFSNETPASPEPQLFKRKFAAFLLKLYECMKLVYYQRMRSDEDKTFIRNAFGNVFNCDAEQLNCLSEDVALYWTADKIYLNDIVLQRSAQTNALNTAVSSKELAPLLLSSQRELLKQIIETVHMEKPVLLCGPTDTGKTKLIDTLCVLSNQICNTDTIDDSVTGSFQQIDLNRHLEEISNNVEFMLNRTVQNAILQQGDAYIIASLLAVWSKYNILAKTKTEFNNNVAVSDELRLFLKRTQMLHAVIEELQQTPVAYYGGADFQSNLRQQAQLLNVLKVHVSAAETLNTGGSFEWVDSKIVKSLKFGQYILLEHVNLCSAAVLDRLNPIFEPNGNLLISEKGVSATDTSEVVEKAANFRAFLTIDPKNGELSRAMRNRCVEISIAKDTYDVDDMRAIVHNQGVHNIVAIDCLLRIHASVCSLTEIHTYTISHLKELAFLTASYKRIGYEFQRAIYVSAMEVYVYAANMDLMGYGLAYYQNKLRETVLEETQQFATKYAEDQYEVNSLADVILNCADLSSSALVKLQVAPLETLLKSTDSIPKAQLAALFYKIEELDFTKLSIEQLSTFYLYLIYEVSAVGDIALRHHYLHELLRDEPALKALADKFNNCIEQQAAAFDVNLQALPWNRLLLPRIRDYATPQHKDSATHKAFALSATLLAQLLLQQVHAQQLGKLQQIDVLTYSQAVVSKSITKKLNNTFVEHISTFIERLQQILNAELLNANFSLDKYTQIITAYLWFNRLLSMTQHKLFLHNALNTDLIDKLVLHFKWLQKHLLELISAVLPKYKQLNHEFERSLQKLTDYVLSVKQPLNLMRKVYVKELTQFQPFYQQEQIDVYTLAMEVDQLLNVVPVYGTFTHEEVHVKFQAQKSLIAKQLRAFFNKSLLLMNDYKFKHSIISNTNIVKSITPTLQQALQQLMTELSDDSNAEVEQIDFDELRLQIEQLHQELIKAHDACEAGSPTKSIELGLLPLREYFLAKIITQKLYGAANRKAINALYCEEIQNLNSDTWQLINTLKSSKHMRLNTILSELTVCIDTCNLNADFAQLLSYLNGSYKHFSTYQRLLSSANLSYQLTNLAARGNCTRLTAKSELESCYQYEGPALTNAVTALIFQTDGQLRPVPLYELDNWRAGLQQKRQLMWHNSGIMTRPYNMQLNNLQHALHTAKRLLCEVEYVTQICANQANDGFSEYNAGFQLLAQELHNAYDALKALDDDANASYQHLQYNTALANTLIGALELCLLTFVPLIDPVEKNRLKNAYIAEDIDCLRTLTTVYDLMRIVMKYKHFGDEIYVALAQRLQDACEKQQKFTQKVALRPDVCIYGKLVQDITHFLQTNCEPNALQKLIELIKSVWHAFTKQPNTKANEASERCNETLNKIELWVANSQRFVHHILKPYNKYYQDFMQPIKCSVNQMLYGLENLKIVLTQLKCADGMHGALRVQRVLGNIIEFPHVKPLAIYNAEVYGLLEKVAHSEHEYFRLLKAKLTELRNGIALANAIDESTFREYDFALNVCNQTWQKEEERRRKQKAEEESLYVNKTRCATEDEELIELQEIEANFPTNVEEDFGEFLLEPTLEKVMKLDKKDDLKAKLAQIVRDEDYAFLAENFVEVMTEYARVYYHQPKPQQRNFELIEPYQARLQVFMKLYAEYKACLNDSMDETAYNSLSFAVGLQQRLLNDINFDTQCTRTYDFYKHSNIPEIISCTDVLARIEERVSVQLELYPEHAGLVDIKCVIARIRMLPSTAPVVRFNTGFQLLRQKLALWNEVAHKLNHLRQEEIEVAEYVQRWTKLELQHWRNCLNQTYEQVESHAYKYWFFIYNLFQQYISQQELDNSYTEMKYIEKRFANEEVLDAVDMGNKTKVSVPDLIQILRQFVEAACYGDFHIRLRLLKAFEMYLQNVAACTAVVGDLTDLIAGIHNLQIYFAQFAAEIKESNVARRAPIEKKLKEFVKIESYNKDLSYFSMRNNIARVHRNLNKFLKEFRLTLQEKITPVFQPKDATVKDYNFASDKGRDLRYDTRIKYYLLDAKFFVASEKLRERYSIQTALAANAADEATLLQKVGKHFATARKVVKETVMNANYPKLIIAIDRLLAEQLEHCEHLRNLNVDRSKERAKQKLEAKQILQQKRKALTDLFKTLAQLGFSYKAGLMESSLRTEFENFTMAPFCIKTMLAAEKRLNANLLQLNENLDLYYAKCVFKLKLLQNIMLTPLSELGPPNIERIKGFAIDMFLMVQNQREMLANATKQLYDIGVLLRDLKDIAEQTAAEPNNLKLLDFRATNDKSQALKKSFCLIRAVFKQFELLLTCAPSQENSEHCALADFESPLRKGSPHYNAVHEICENVLKQTKTTLNELQKQSTEFGNVTKLQFFESTLTDVVAQIKKAIGLLRATPTNADEQLPSAQPLIELLATVEQNMKAKHNSDGLVAEPEDFEIIDTELSNIVHTVLVSLQKVYKKHIPAATADAAEEDGTNRKRPCSTEPNGVDAYELEAQHLKKGLYSELCTDWELLNMAGIFGKLNNILMALKHAPATELKLDCVQKMITLIPLLEQYHLLADYYLFQQLGAHKVSAKMLSVMLTVFVEISTKGFCVPADLMQDEEGQAKSDQKEGEGFGLEDGTGENDASDKIESEDQLDDAKRPEDRKDDGDKPEQPDCKEEKGIEMSDDFDGKMQDIEKPENEEDDSGESENEDELNKEMGDTEEGAEKLDDQIWGDDEEEQEEPEEPEMNEEDQGKGSKDEKDAHNDLDTKNDAAKEDGKDEHEKDGLDATNEPTDEDKRKKQEKDIDNMKDQEIDEEQVNEHHNELEEPPEPEEMDLGDMNNADQEGQEDGDEHEGDENPFDIDTMKENMQPPEKEQENEDGVGDEDEQKNEENNDSDSSDSEADEAGTELKDAPDAAEDEKAEEPEVDKEEEAETQKRGDIEKEETEEEQKEEESAEKREEKPEQYAQSKDKPSKEENVQSVPETEQNGSADQVQDQEQSEDIKQEQKMDEQETGEEKDGVGQAENDTNDGGHQGIAETKETISQEERQNEKQTQEKRKQGHTNEERTLGEAEQQKLKQLKTIDKLKEHNDDQNEENDETSEKDVEADEYQHVKEPKNSDKTTLDNATEEQSKKIEHKDDEEEQQDDAATVENTDELMDVDDEQAENQEEDEHLEQLNSEKTEQKSDKPSKTEKSKERIETHEEMEIEGEVVPTITVPRSTDTTAHYNNEIILDKSTLAQDMSTAEQIDLRKMYQQQLTMPNAGMPQHEDYENWQSISNRMTQNARELCEQLRLILEPTKCTRLKGDYRTGRRINMKKIIPYIASQFRKDKIWLRRTKPAQRDYKITIAIDDSKSMHHNNSKTLTLEAISLVSQALTLLESGRLSIVSFGEKPQIILNHTEQFDGPKLVGALNFSQDKTRIAGLLDFIRTVNVEEGALGGDNGLFENLLLILSDGRNIYSEGKQKVNNAIKLARMQRIFLVYIIIDNPDNKNSILDVQHMEVAPDKSISLKSYLDVFPFPYYVIVRDLNQLPLVLSEAMRQWFELVNSEL